MRYFHGILKLLYAIFWVIPRRLNFICRRFGTHCSIFTGGYVWRMLHTYPPMKMEQTECSETSAYKIRRRGITQKKAYKIPNKAKVWNQES